MSATGRKSNRRQGDAYDSPPEACDAILRLVPGMPVFDPCAGVGSFLCAARRAGVAAKGLEIDPTRAALAREIGHDVVEQDALGFDSWSSPPAVVTNPPYRKALEFVERSLVEVAPGGTVVMLLRLGFLESIKRRGFHQKHPADVFVLSRRPSFTGGKTDATAYAFFAWGPGRGNRWSLI
jgi:predicted RNA methylase